MSEPDTGPVATAPYAQARSHCSTDAPLPCTPYFDDSLRLRNEFLSAGVYVQRPRHRIAETQTVHDTFQGAVSNTAVLFPRLFDDGISDGFGGEEKVPAEPPFHESEYRLGHPAERPLFDIPILDVVRNAVRKDMLDMDVRHAEAVSF